MKFFIFSVTSALNILMLGANACRFAYEKLLLHIKLDRQSPRYALVMFHFTIIVIVFA